jgi:putative proteasome-type protease
MLAATLLDAAEMVGRTLHEVSTTIADRMQEPAPAALLLAGQRRGGTMRLFLIYPPGNFIEATEDAPYLQIGELKYGKPILDRVVTPGTSLAEGRTAALLSMDSTMRSNLSVGMPLDLVTIRRDEYRVTGRERFEPGDPKFTAISEAWGRALRDAFASMPD